MARIEKYTDGGAGPYGGAPPAFRAENGDLVFSEGGFGYWRDSSIRRLSDAFGKPKGWGLGQDGQVARITEKHAAMIFAANKLGEENEKKRNRHWI